MAEQLSAIISKDHEDLLIGISRCCFHTLPTDANNILKEYNYSWIVQNYEMITKYLIPSKEYANTEISQVYASYKNYNFKEHFSLFKQLFANKKLLLVCGDKVFANIKYNILENANVKYIYGPTKHAYSDLDKLSLELRNTAKDETLLFAIGPAGKVLAYEMFLKGYRVLDVGHVIKDYDAYMNGTDMTDEAIKNFFAPDA